MKLTLRIVLLLVLDAICFNASYVLSYLLRFAVDGAEPLFSYYFPVYYRYFIYLTLIKIAVFTISGMYRSLWDFAGPRELLKVVFASLVSTMFAIAFLVVVQTSPIMPRSIYILSFVFDVVLTGGVRVMYRYARAVRQRQGLKGFLKQFIAGGKAVSGRTRVLLIGAGEAGATIIREIKANPLQNIRVVAALDDDEGKQGRLLMGVRIEGGTEDIATVCEKRSVDMIIIAIPSASRSEIKNIAERAGKTGAKVQILPSMIDLIGGVVSVSALRDIDIEDLLGREPVKLDAEGISEYLKGRRVLVTGGGGSIGSELCRQIAGFQPEKLIALDIAENGVFDLERELSLSYPDLPFETLIVSVRDRAMMKRAFDSFRPQVVFHAAAHKHVPMMEKNPAESIVNNVLGTKNAAELAIGCGVEKFVMISTDKAVNPSSVMGASKRLAEMVLQEMSGTSDTVFAIVRFGNVLGSSGSVVPLFRKQIADGGPVTVTDRDITRYFMTIPEAVQLVIQSGAISKGGEVFILDMGEPVRIVDLAENLIRLSGYRPYDDIPIVITGLRPGEKLHEELSYANEILVKTAHDKIYLGAAQRPSEELIGRLRDGASLARAMEDELPAMSDEGVRAWLRNYLPSYGDGEKGEGI